jgi:TolA-binding protein
MNLALLITDNVGKDSITEPLRIYSRAELLAFQNKDDLALLTLDSVLTLFPERDITDDVWFKQSGIFLKKKNTSKAMQLLLNVVDKYPDGVLADDALFKLGDLYENVLKDNAKAMETYQKFLEKYPGSLFIADVRKRFRTLRGDKIN